MRDYTVTIGTLLGAAALASAIALPGTASAQGKIVCWKDKAGKVIGCGDKVPPEFQSSATKELDSRGVTRKTTESVEDVNRRRAQAKEAARLKAEEDRKMVDQKRQDTALLETYSNEKEIELKRDRDLQVIDLQIEQLNVSLKNVTQRHSDATARAAAVEKNKKPLSAGLKDEIARTSADKQRLEQTIAGKNKEKEELRQRYADYRKRYTELRSGASQAQAPVAAKK